MIDKDMIPKDLFGTESEVITRLSNELKCTRTEAKGILIHLVNNGVVLGESSLSYPGVPSVSVYSYNKNFDWDAYENSRYIKYRYMVVGTYKRVKLSDIHEFNNIVEWNRRDLGDLINEIKKELNLPPVKGITEYDISISNLIEIGYPTEKD